MSSCQPAAPPPLSQASTLRERFAGGVFGLGFCEPLPYCFVDDFTELHSRPAMLGQVPDGIAHFGGE